MSTRDNGLNVLCIQSPEARGSILEVQLLGLGVTVSESADGVDW